MVDVTHYNDNGRSFDKFFGLVGFLCFRKELIFNGNDNFLFDFYLEFIGDKVSSVEVDCLVNRCHNAHRHELFDNLAGGYLHTACKLGNRDFVGYGYAKLNGLRLVFLRNVFLLVKAVTFILVLIIAAIILLLYFLLCVAVELVGIRYDRIKFVVVFGGVYRCCTARIDNTHVSH